MPRSRRHEEEMRRDLGTTIDSLDLPDMSKRFLRTRWLDQILWMDQRSSDTRARYYLLRISGFVAGAVIPVLAAYNYNTEGVAISRSIIAILGLVVVLTAGLEELLRYGDRWRECRRCAELLKIEGWRFFQMAEPYGRFETHAAAYSRFAHRIEDLLRRDVQTYVAELRETTDHEGSAQARS